MTERQGTHWDGCGDSGSPRHAGCPKSKGFGPAVPLLGTRAPAKHPWLTPEVAARELAIEEHQSDPTAVFMDSVE